MWHCSCQGCVGSLYDADGEPVGPALPNSVANQGPRGRQTDSGTKRAEIHQGPGLYLTPDKQAGYMTATEFQIASAIQPLTRAGSIYAWRCGVDSNSRFRLFSAKTANFRDFPFSAEEPDRGQPSPRFDSEEG